jgi:hypothetical protein
VPECHGTASTEHKPLFHSFALRVVGGLAATAVSAEGGKATIERTFPVKLPNTYVGAAQCGDDAQPGRGGSRDRSKSANPETSIAVCEVTRGSNLVADAGECPDFCV